MSTLVTILGICVVSLGFAILIGKGIALGNKEEGG